MQNFNPKTKIALLGGGQLGRMMLQAAVDLDIYIKVLDPDPAAPCALLANEFVCGSFQDYHTVMDFAADCDLVSIEIENVSIEALLALEKAGKKVFPQPGVLQIIKNKRLQKQFYIDHQIPTADFVLVENREDILANKAFFPCFNKIGEGGYDGRGVQKINDIADVAKGFDAPGLLEKAIDFEKELAVIVARNENGHMETFPTVEMVFHPEQNLVEYLYAPAQVNDAIHQNAQEIAKEVAAKLGIVGLLAVEMFLDKEGKILVNEVAPRCHNSGHHTIRANYTSQFEQHLRAILNLPLGSTQMFCPAAMLNILGEAGYEGPVQYTGMDEALSIEGVFPFLYGKKITKPYRKMGHVTVLGTNKADIEAKIDKVKACLKVIA